jgi:hypothetical protein
MLICLPIAILYFLGTTIKTSRLRVNKKVGGTRRREGGLAMKDDKKNNRGGRRGTQSI